jgi:hypothetical protein
VWDALPSSAPMFPTQQTTVGRIAVQRAERPHTWA